MDNGHLNIEEIEQLIQQKGPAEYQTHVGNCQHCRSLLEKSRAFSANLVKLASVRIEAGNAMKCPDERVWFDVAAGTLAQGESLKYVQHAAECPSCGQRLKAATGMFDEELSPEEKQTLAALPSSARGAQRDLARRLADAGQTKVQSDEEKPKPSFWKPLTFSLAGAAAATVIVLAFLFFNRHDSPADVEKLLAQAYTENRTIEIRIPFASYGKIRQTRSSSETSVLASPESFRKATDEVAYGLKRQPLDPRWLTMEAKLDLLADRVDAALATLTQIDQRQSSADILLTRALVLYQQGEKLKAPELYMNALDLFGRVLQAEPNDPVVLFNRALTCEKLKMYECALKDWQSVIQLERDPGWKAEAQQHLEYVQEKKTFKY